MLHIRSSNKDHTGTPKPTFESAMYINQPTTSVILDGVDGKCVLTGVHTDGHMEFPTPTSSATSSTSQEESSSDGGSILAMMDDVDKSLSYNSTTSDNDSASQSYNGSSLYSMQLPGFGRVLAVNTRKSCDVDILYEEQKKAVDVDAFVDVDTDEEEEEEEQDLPMYQSKTKESIPEGILAHCNFNGGYDDIEAPSSLDLESCTMDKLSTLDPNSDPFAQRVGKKLSWRKVNMTLVRLVAVPCRSAMLHVARKCI
jgi:hypothetical protein